MGFHLVAEVADAHGFALAVGGQDFERIPAQAEHARLQFKVVALVLDIHQLPQERVAAVDFALLDGEHALAVGFRVTQSVDGGDRGDDDDILAGHHAGGGGKAQRSISSLMSVSFSM
jgi:hypothetical protein